MKSNFSRIFFGLWVATVPVCAAAQVIEVECDAGVPSLSVAGSNIFGGVSELCDQSDIDTIVDELADIVDEVTDNDRVIAILRSRTINNRFDIREAEADISVLNGEQTTQDARLDALDAEGTDQAAAIATNASDIDRLEGRATAVEDRATVLEGRATAVENRASALERFQAAATDTLNDHETRITTNEGVLANHEGRITQNEADIATLNTNVGTLRQDMNRGLAMANAMEVIAPDPGAAFRMNIGTGFHDGASAMGITATGRMADNTIVYFGFSGTKNYSAGKAGISFQW